MGAKKSRLLQRAKDSPYGWNRIKIDRLYQAFGFIIINKKKHDLAVHPNYPQLRGTLTRSSGEIHRDYVDHAVDLIEKSIELKGDENE